MKMQVIFIFLFFLGIFPFYQNYAQSPPEITGIEKPSGTVDEIIDIYGKNFNTNKSTLVVFFGAAPAEVLSARSDQIRVKLPSGTTYGTISVTHTNSGLTAYSNDFFLLSYDGKNFSTNQLKTRVDVQADPTLQNMCVCDLNKDGLNDIITSHADEQELNILKNGSTLKNTSFSLSRLNVDAENLHVSCGDLDGDGFPDLVVTSSNNNNDKDHIFVIKNKSTQGGNISMANAKDAGTDNGGFSPLIIQGNQTSKTAIRDLNRDGKPEIVVTERSGEAAISIFKNTSEQGTLSFSSDPITPGSLALSLFGISIGDVNSDGKPDIVASGDVSDDLLIYLNNGESGGISFGNPVSLQLNANVFNVALVDLNRDGKKDIVANRRNATEFIVFMNTFSEETGELSFGEATGFSAGLVQWGMDIADMNGDGNSDIVFGTIDESKISVVINETAKGGNTPVFTTKLITTNERNRNVIASDLNSDGKPDLAFTGLFSNKASIYITENCINPQLEPLTGLGVCDTLPFPLHATRSRGVTYSWEIDSTSSLDLSADEISLSNFKTIKDTDSTDYIAQKEAFYRYQFTDTINGQCQSYSNIVKVTRPEGFVPDKPTIINQNPEDPVCFGQNFQLEAEYVDAKYIWEGPDGFTSNEQNPVIENMTKAKEGTYTLQVQAEKCKSAVASTYIKVNEPEDITIQSNNPGVIFEGGKALLKVKELANHTYRWKRNDGSWEKGDHTYTATDAGNYVAEIKDTLGCTKKSDTFRIEIARATIPESNCQNLNADYQVTPEKVNGNAIDYKWHFGDQNNQNGAQVSYQYRQEGDYTVYLNIIGNNGENIDTIAQQITIHPVPELSLSTENGAGICRGKAANIQVQGNFASFEWDHGPTSKNITVREAGKYVVTAYTDQNCSVTDSIKITNFQNPQARVKANDTSISVGDSVRLTASGGARYLWEPDQGLDDPEAPNPLARPNTTTTYKVTVINGQGCQDTAIITINVDKTLEVDAPRVFTPNGDGKNDQWRIDGIDLYEDCTVQIFNRQGKVIYEASPYKNANGWDGSDDGSQLPEGAYYYVIKCDGETGRKSGSISILR